MATHYTFKSDWMNHSVCYGADLTRALAVVEATVELGAIATLTPYRNESDEWNEGRISQHRCPVCVANSFGVRD